MVGKPKSGRALRRHGQRHIAIIETIRSKETADE